METTLAVQAEEIETPKEQAARLKKERGLSKKKDDSLPILLMQSEFCDYNPGARMVLMVIALGQRTNPNAYVPEDSPYTAEQYIGWCDRAEWGIALRGDIPVSQVLPNEQERQNYQFVRHDMRVDDVTALFAKLALLEAVFVTASGDETESLLGIATRWDILHIP